MPTAMCLLWAIACMFICSGCANGLDQISIKVGSKIKREGRGMRMQPQVTEAGQ